MSGPPDSCPRCRGAMRPTHVGELQDKHLECEFCGHLVDVDDSSSVTREESERFTDAHGRLVQRTRRTIRTRHDGPLPTRDVPPDAPGVPAGLRRPALFERPDGSSTWVDLADPEGLGEELRGQLEGALDEGALADLVRRLQDAPDGFKPLGDVHEVVHESVVDLPWGGGPLPEPVSAQRPLSAHRPAPRWAAPPAPAAAGAPPATWMLLAAVGFGVLATLLLVAILT